MDGMVSDDPCGKLMAVYEDCVKKHTFGLRTDEECLDEAEAYKLCRKRISKENRIIDAKR